MGKRAKRQQEPEDERQRSQDGDVKPPGKNKTHEKSKRKRSAVAEGDAVATAAQAALSAAAADGGVEGQPSEQQAEMARPAAGSHDADAPAVQQQKQQQTPVNVPGQQRQQAAKANGGKPAPVLPWMRVPIAIEASEGVLLEEVKGLDPRLKTALEGSGIEVLFPVQAVVWAQTAGGASQAHDVCICAPTGSGKTLSYALPVLQALAGRAVPRLRALAVLPTRDLASQVFSVLSTLCPALGLTACLACGKAGLAAEAELLAAGGIDILVATPGRLITHLESTPGFSLRHLRFLIADETDRLLRQAYQGWLPKVMAALHGGSGGGADDESPSDGSHAGGGGGGAEGGSDSEPAAWENGAPSGAAAGAQQSRRVVKFVVSATLTRDPSKIDRLQLTCPRYIAMSAVDHRYKLPRSLQEAKLVVPAERKPAALAALLQELSGESTIVFTSSVDATHRLYILLAALSCLADRVVEFSSLIPPAERAANLEAFRSGAAKVLVCSDAMTRGMDVEGVQNVVNYDAPVYVKTYVHRAGRTARAGRAGRVFTLLRHEDVRHFKDMLRKADNTFVKDHRLTKGAMEAVRDDVDDALDRMAAQLLAEQQAAGQQPQQQAEVGKAPTSADGAGQQQQRGGGKALKRRRLAGVPELCLMEA